MPPRLRLTLCRGLLYEHVNHVAVQRMHHDKRTSLSRDLPGPEQCLVIDHERALVSHEQLVAGHPLIPPCCLDRSIPRASDQRSHTAWVDEGAVLWQPQNVLSTLENMAFLIQGIYAEMRYFRDCVLESAEATRGSLEFAPTQ